MRKLAIYALLFCALPLLAQTSAITATVTDSDSVAWATLNGYNAPYSVTLVSSTGQNVPAGQAYRKDTGATTTNTYSGNLDGTGSLSLTLTSNSNITPAGTQWAFVVCSAVSSSPCAYTKLTVNASGSLSSQLSAVTKPPRVGGGINNWAYSDVEVASVPNNSYYNITTPALRCYGASWSNCGSGGGGTIPSQETVASSATPTFSATATLSRMVLTSNVTTFTLPAGTAGFRKCINFVQGAGPYTVLGPANVHALFAVGTISGDNNVQCWMYDSGATAWLAEATGVINQ